MKLCRGSHRKLKRLLKKEKMNGLKDTLGRTNNRRLPDKKCPCGIVFRPGKARNKYHSRRCYLDIRRKNKKHIRHYRNSRPWIKNLESARRRCRDKKLYAYKWYGRRGIKCLLTRNDAKFLWDRDKAADMAQPTIDRIDNDGHYTRDNCRFMENRHNVSGRIPVLESKLTNKVVE